MFAHPKQIKMSAADEAYLISTVWFSLSGSRQAYIFELNVFKLEYQSVSIKRKTKRNGVSLFSIIAGTIFCKHLLEFYGRYRRIQG